VELLERVRLPPFALNKMVTGTAKGMRDTLPAEQLEREEIMERLRQAFRSFGFRPFDTPAIEEFSLLSAKYAGGDEILGETFSLKDRGNRKLGLRYDLTVPLARFIANNPQLKLPFKRYQISKVWRDGPMGFGRYREFWQCDVDPIGSPKMDADAEILALADSAFRLLGLKVEIRLNSRKLLNGILDRCGIQTKTQAILVLDKLEKLSKQALINELCEKGIGGAEALDLLEFFSKIPQGKAGLGFLKREVKTEEGLEGIAELEALIGLLAAYKVKVKFTPELARGLSYYTSTVYEIFTPELNFSLAGGGRYDRLIGGFLESSQQVPAVGISFGLDRIRDAFKAKTKSKEKQTPTQVLIIPINAREECIALAQRLRKAGVFTETDIAQKGLTKNLNYANSLQIPYVVFVGQKELQAGRFRLKDMGSGKERLVGEAQLIKLLTQHP
jgi:histidyl-tRNA synthetase